MHMLLGTLLAIGLMMGPASASQTTFCNNWTGVCKRTCPSGDCTTECNRRKAVCYRSGCFEFSNRGGGERCFSNAAHRRLVNVK